MKLLTFIACILISINSYSQNFKKDIRPDSVKEDFLDNFQAGQISKVDLLRALNSLGVRVFNCQLLPRFTKTYKLTVDVDEFVNGKNIKTTNVSPNEKNIYFFWDNEKQYADFANKIQIIARDADSVTVISVDIMGNSTGMKLKKNLDRKYQWYDWRRFSETNWTLNTKIPILVYSSSWYDKRFDIERSCGAFDLSKDKAATKELLDNSSHYFLISYKIAD